MESSSPIKPNLIHRRLREMRHDRAPRVPVDSPQRSPELPEGAAFLHRADVAQESGENRSGIPAVLCRCVEGCASVPRLVGRPHLLPTGIAKDPRVQPRRQDHRHGAEPGEHAGVLPQVLLSHVRRGRRKFRRGLGSPGRSRQGNNLPKGLRVSGSVAIREPRTDRQARGHVAGYLAALTGEDRVLRRVREDTARTLQGHSRIHRYPLRRQDGVSEGQRGRSLEESRGRKDHAQGLATRHQGLEPHGRRRRHSQASVLDVPLGAQLGAGRASGNGSGRFVSDWSMCSETTYNS